ncbi:uncharacterized protein LOC123889572 [Trifolium pratense]|uniref:uncharacterized protein LOC123889572 n=1 Tax=Trifolium pratense TaxID=57577 RepID=UPI001E693067|nr:uncharacterized protein LOC123889572 [Trifolium pratense]
MFKWFCDNHPYGREFYYGGAPPISRDDLIDHIRKFGDSGSQEAKEDLLEKSRSIELDQEEEEVFYSNELPWDELDEYHLKKCCCSGRYNGSEVFYSNKLSWDEHNEYQEKRSRPCCYIGSDRLPDFERGTLFLYNNGDPIIIMKD